ncbi:TPA: ATP-binding protein [Bacillus cereus]|nr:ATP-binding protein [Bacillus cereus]
MQTLYFDSSSNLKDLIGRRLVTNKISAIFELVKNSFDADALEVVVEFDEENNQLTISDNGDGMTYEDIKNKWMVIGTDNKKGRIYTKSGRPLNGEKGIGRFSADRLGKRLTLISETVNSNKAIKMEFDWEKFEEREEMRLSDIPVEYHYIESKKEKGVTLIISDLRDEWDDIEISKLEKRLRGLLSPFQETKKDKFSIVLDSKIYGYNKKKLTSYDLGDISSLWIEMEI